MAIVFLLFNEDNNPMSKNVVIKANSFGPYKAYRKPKDSTLKFGTYFEKSVLLPFDTTAERMIRVWLPSGYGDDPKKRYPVIYMSDGQNLVDRAMSAYGDWHLDKVVHSLMKDEHLPGVILVGIDCPKNPVRRCNELNPPYRVRRSFSHIRGPNHPYGNKFVDYIVNDLKPEIDKYFLTMPDLMHTGIGGSSMGGIMAFYAYMAYPDTFGFSLAFSIPTFAYSKKRWKELIEEWKFDPFTHRKLAMWVGGKGFERNFTRGNKWMVKYLKKLGMDDHNLHFECNTSLPHHEEAWYTYSFGALRFFLKDC